MQSASFREGEGSFTFDQKDSKGIWRTRADMTPSPIVLSLSCSLESGCYLSC